MIGHSINSSPTSIPLDGLLPTPQTDPREAQKPRFCFPKQELVTTAPDARGYYVFKGAGGIPFRSTSSAAPDIKSDELRRQPVIVLDAQVEVLTLPADVQKYAELWDLFAKGRAVLSAEDRQWIPETKEWRVLLRYGLRWWELPQ